MTSIEYIVRQTMKANVEFITHVKDVTFKHISGLLDRKGNEYSNDENRFENFLEGADVENTTPEKVLWFFVLKHFLSIKKFIRETETPQRRPLSQWTEKIDDIITYMILLKAIVAKRQEIETEIRNKESEKEQL